jgi:hypothetical protein
LFTAYLGLLAIGLLAACQPTPDAPPTAPADANSTGNLAGMIEWVRAPDYVVFRAGVIITDRSDFFAPAYIPDCTLYGDNRVVYRLPRPEGGSFIAVGTATDEAVRTFIADATLTYQIFNQNPSTTDLTPENLPAQYEAITIAVNGDTRTFDALGGWDSSYYQSLAERCRGVSSAPAEFAPLNGAWLTVRKVDYHPDRPSYLWDAGSGLDLASMAERGRTWVTGAGVILIWDAQLQLDRPDIQFQQGDSAYQVMIQVPGITPDSPPAP